MCEDCSKTASNFGEKKGASLDTLAQLVTNFHNTTENQEFEKLKSLAENQAVLRKRARRNYLKNALSLGLIDVNKIARKKRVEDAENVLQELEADRSEKDILRSYWNMYHCSGKLVRKNGKISGRYCKNRLCLVCNSIRTAVLITQYKPILDEWEDAYFVTLTAPTIKESKLHSRVEEMESIALSVRKNLNQRFKRKQCSKFQGIRKLECTYNPFANKYHPHFHFIIKGKENAEYVYNEWLKRTRHLGTSHKAQDCQPARKGALMEIFKYFTKIVSSSSKDRNIYLKALDVIFKEFRGRRVIQSFGFTLPKEVEETTVIEVIKHEEIENIEELQTLLSNRESDRYISTRELLEKLDGKSCFNEVLQWLEEEEQRGLPFLEIGTIQEILEELKKDFEEKEENFIWSQELSDWISEDTGELLTGFEVSENMRELVGRMVKTLRVDWKKKE